MEGVLLPPLRFEDPQRLVKVSDQVLGVADEGSQVTAPDIIAYARGMHSLQAFGGYQNLSYELSGAGKPKQINAARISAGALAALEVMPATGRLFTREEHEGAQPVALLSYGLWLDRFHRNPNILGAKVLLDRKPYIVIGILPRGFEFPLNPGRLNRSEIWVPLSLRSEELTAAAANWTFEAEGLRKGSALLKRRGSISGCTRDYVYLPKVYKQPAHRAPSTRTTGSNRQASPAAVTHLISGSDRCLAPGLCQPVRAVACSDAPLLKR